MAFYEHVVLARPSMSPQQIEALTAHVSGIVDSNGGKVANTEYWGLRPLAHPIKKMRKAHYTMLLIEAPPGLVSELERQARINEDIVRYLTVRVDELADGPSPMMARKERSDRPARRPQQEGGAEGERPRRPQQEGGAEEERPRRPAEQRQEA